MGGIVISPNDLSPESLGKEPLDLGDKPITILPSGEPECYVMPVTLPILMRRGRAARILAAAAYRACGVFAVTTFHRR